jgi:putative ABC transport system permease protein
MENMTVTAPGASESVEFELYRVDPGFFRHLGIERPPAAPSPPAWRWTTARSTPTCRRRGRRGDGAARLQRVLNRLAARRLGFADPRQAVGKTLLGDDGDVETNGRTPVTIIGVVEDSRFRSVRDPLAPMMFLYERTQPSWLLVHYDGIPG